VWLHASSPGVECGRQRDVRVVRAVERLFPSLYLLDSSALRDRQRMARQWRGSLLWLGGQREKIPRLYRNSIRRDTEHLTERGPRPRGQQSLSAARPEW